MPSPNPQFELLGRQLLIGLGRIGGRAAASAVKSVVNDGRRIAEQAEERLKSAASRIDEMLGGEQAPRDRKSR